MQLEDACLTREFGRAIGTRMFYYVFILVIYKSVCKEGDSAVFICEIKICL